MNREKIKKDRAMRSIRMPVYEKKGGGLGGAADVAIESTRFILVVAFVTVPVGLVSWYAMNTSGIPSSVSTALSSLIMITVVGLMLSVLKHSMK